MDVTLDPQLRFVIEQAAAPDVLGELAESRRFALAEEEPELARVLVRYEKTDWGELTDVGLRISTVAGDVITGLAPVEALPNLAEHADVQAIEGARPLVTELDLSVPACQADAVHAGTPITSGKGVIVGIVDSGIDWRHVNFQNASGASRILNIWDQSLTSQSGESPPPGFQYGVEYSNADIIGALGQPNPQAAVRHDDGSAGHGTHVSGIAAGNGAAAGQQRSAGTFVGMAPDADLIVVAVRGGSIDNRGIGDSASALDAVSYIFQRAAALDRPVVTNMSLGDNLGAHDGTSLLERGLDNLLNQQGCAMVKSAGNAGADGIHAEGTVSAGTNETVGFSVAAKDSSPETIDIWYDRADRFDLRVVDPEGESSAVIPPETSTTVNLGNGNAIFVDSSVGDPNNGDNRIFLVLRPGEASSLAAGSWSLVLTGTTVANGRFDAWIQRGSRIARFEAPHESAAMTISTPGTAMRMITAASWVSRGAGLGDLSTFSSRGPTRDGRNAPDVAAPGQVVVSTRSGAGTDPYVSMSGTSMAAPHVTGAVALMLQRNPKLDQQEIKECLATSAAGDGYSGVVPNGEWGAGKLDSVGAVSCANSKGPVGGSRPSDAE